VLHERLGRTGIKLTRLRRIPAVLSLAAMLTAVAACGGPADGMSELIDIVPAAAEVGPGETLRFATDPDESVGW
jgi:hypothetical protein